MPNTTESRHQAELDATAAHNHSPSVSHEGGGGGRTTSSERRRKRGNTIAIYSRKRIHRDAPSRAREILSPSRARLREPPCRPPKRPACVARSCAPRKRILAALPGSQAQAGFLAVFSQAVKRTNLINTATYSPRARPGCKATHANTPLELEAGVVVRSVIVPTVRCLGATLLYRAGTT
jgi:hypothetical protein